MNITGHPRGAREPDAAFDRRDRLIVALYAQLKAERETRAALEEAIRSGAVSREVLGAIASDPVPVITSEDIAATERMLARNTRAPRRSALARNAGSGGN